MRNSKVKGFTLIELIVVIAIIGILAAILVPSMLGYVRNSRISQANANAKQVHTAVSSALTQMSISNYSFSTNTGYKGIKVNPASSGKITVDTSEFTIKPNPADVSATFDLVSYLGENFSGYGYAYFNTATCSVKLATWQQGSAKVLTEAVTEETQKSECKSGTIYGCYPTKAVGQS